MYPVEIQVQGTELQGREVDVVFAVDVSSRVASEKEQERLQLQLQHAQKMEAIGLLAGGVAHDFNNLLMAIGGFAELLGEHPDAEVRDTAVEILRAQARGATLTRQLLAFARKEVVRPRLCDPQHIVKELEPLLKRLAGETVELVIRAEACRPVWVDRGQFEQTVVNLVSNARDALPANGHIDVNVGDAAGDGGVHEVRLTVSDNGHGMDEATRARIFEPFFTTKSRHKGTGLGLAVVLGIVSQHGGRIDVESTPGRGTTVSVFWPEAPNDLQADPEIAASAGWAPPSHTGGTILVTDDDDGARAYLRRVLERAGYRVVEARDGGHALELARSHPGGVDLLITDIVMPGIGGFELAERFKGESPDTPALFMSGYVDERTVAPSGPGGLPDVIPKPFKAAELLALVADTLRVSRQAQERREAAASTRA